MKFLLVKNKIININLITQIFIQLNNGKYDIVIFYEGYDFTAIEKSKQFIIYKKLETKEEAEKELSFLVDRLNSC